MFRSRSANEPIVDFPDDSDIESISSEDHTKHSNVDFEELEAEDDQKVRPESRSNQVPIKLSDGTLIFASFTYLEDPVPPPWSVFYRKGGETENIVNVSIDKDDQQGFPPKTSGRTSVERDVADILTELKQLGKLPQKASPG